MFINKSTQLLFGFAVFILTNPVFSIAQVHQGDSDHESNHHHDKNHLALFLGASSNLEHSHTAFTLGLDYEYRFAEKFGTGLLAEYIFEDQAEVLLGVPIVWHPVQNLKIMAAPLVAFSILKVIPDGTQLHLELGLRLGTAYDFHFKNNSIGPAINLDFIDGNTVLVYGLNFGVGF
jgi:hypothetical protein